MLDLPSGTLCQSVPLIGKAVSRSSGSRMGPSVQKPTQRSEDGNVCRDLLRDRVMIVCALIAAFNEEAYIGDVVFGTAPHVSRVLVVDDGSSDRTAAVARDAGAIVLKHDTNRGKGCAIRT